MRMKKLLMFLVLLTVSIGLWAGPTHTWTSSDGQYTVTVSELDAGWHDIGYGNKEYEATKVITVNKAGALAAYWAEQLTYTDPLQPGQHRLDIPHHIKNLVIEGPMNANDFAVITGDKWNNATNVDLSKVTVSNASDVQSMNLSNIETVVLPNGFTKAEVNAAGAYFTTCNANFGSCISMDPEEIETTTYETKYYYTPTGSSEEIEFPNYVNVNGENYSGTVNEPITVDLTPVGSSNSYTNTYNNNKEVTVEIEEGQTSWIPNPLDVALTATSSEYTINGRTVNSWDTYVNNGNTYLYDWAATSYGLPSDASEADRLVSVTATYTITKTGEPYGTFVNGANQDPNSPNQLFYDNGTAYGQIANNGDDPISFTVQTSYTYSYTLDGQPYTYESENGNETTYSTTHDVTYSNTDSEHRLTAQEIPNTTSSTSTSVTAYVKTAGTLYKATNMAYMYDGLEALKKDNSTNDVISAIETVVISGNVTLDDISQASATYADPLDTSLTPAAPEGEGKFTVDAETYHPAFYFGDAGAPIKDFDLSSATIDDPVYLRTVSNNSALERIVFPENLTSIPYACCYANGTSGNYKLKDIVFPQGLAKIGAYAFHGVAITELYVRNNTTSIGWEAFGSCPNLADLVFEAGLTDLSYDGYVFDSCPSLKHVVFPEGVTHIGNYIFNMCESLESIHLPNSLESIGDGAFHECLSIRTLVIPENVHTIGKQALSLCYIEDLFLMAEDVQHLPAIYSSGSDFGTGTSSFARNQLDANKELD